MVKTDILLVLIVFGLFLCSGELPAQTIYVTDRDCAGAVAHQPAADVAYRPGVDVNGRPVASADIGGGSTIGVPKKITIPITLDLQKRLGILPDPAQYQTSDFVVGEVTWEKGQVYFNGKPVQSEAAAHLNALCQRG